MRQVWQHLAAKGSDAQASIQGTICQVNRSMDCFHFNCFIFSHVLSILLADIHAHDTTGWLGCIAELLSADFLSMVRFVAL